ncbi:MAG: FtsW/RodA/SpoVE family cell cycle protein, partial [Microcystaceae cyanobacterium]
MLRYLIPIYDPEVSTWSGEARLLRWFTFAWILLGLIVLFSASYPEGVANYDNDGLYIIKRQLLFVWLGLIGFNVIVRSPLSNMLKLAPWMVFVFLALIMVTAAGIGAEVNGATRWIPIGPFLLQPSELMKPFLVLQSAYLFGNWPKLSWPVRIFWVGVFGLILISILLQPNLSTTALCGMTIWLIALASGLPFGYLGTTATLGVMAAVVSVSFREYHRK